MWHATVYGRRLRNVSLGSSHSETLLPKSKCTPTHSLPARFNHAACPAQRDCAWGIRRARRRSWKAPCSEREPAPATRRQPRRPHTRVLFGSWREILFARHNIRVRDLTRDGVAFHLIDQALPA